MKTKIAIPNVCAIVIIVTAFFLPSCRSPLQGVGDASVSFILGGVIPSVSSSSAAAGSRAITPNAAKIRVSVVGSGVDRTTESSVSASTVNIENLPAGVSLTFSVAALDAAGNAITSWTGTRMLSAGVNSVTATLAPDASAVTALTVTSGNASSVTAPTLNAGGIVFYRLTVDSGLTGERQVLLDTGKARWVWMGVYDANWNTLAPVASDQNQGWVVLNVDTTRVINVALYNGVSSPGYPSGSISGTLAVRPAVFFASGASGAGTSSAPAAFGSYSFGNASANGASFFLQGGSYLRGGSMDVMSPYSQRFYGGFDAGSWNSRTAVSEIGNTFGAVNTLYFDSGISGCLDKLTVRAQTVASGITPEATGVLLYASTTGTFVVSNCELYGSPSCAGTSGVTSFGAKVSGNVEFSGCVIDGGSATCTSGGSASATGLSIYSTASLPVYVHNCVVSGGTASATANLYDSTTSGIRNNSTTATLVVACCEIWGGAATKTTASGASVTYGVYGDTGLSIVANSRICGGYSSTSSTYANSIGVYQFSSSTTNCLVAGNTIAGGYAATPVSTNKIGYAVVTSMSAAGGSLYGNALFAAAYDAASNEAGVDCAMGKLSTFIANSVFSAHAWYDAYSVARYDVFTGLCGTPTDNYIDTSRQPGSEFVSYADATTFAAFRSQNWRPASGALYAGKTGTTSPFTALQVQTYPALGMDLAGKARPSVWARGSYEP